MWKVKRMNAACIVVLTAADGGIAAYLASRSDNRSLPATPIEQPPAMEALVAKDEPLTANGADWTTAVLPAGIRVRGPTRILK
jgi:flagellar basal body-associated protein FliL